YVYAKLAPDAEPSTREKKAKGPMADGPFCAGAAGTFDRPAGLKPLEKLFDRNDQRPDAALWSLVAELHRVCNFRIHIPSQRFQIGPRAAGAGSWIEDQDTIAAVFRSHQPAADNGDGRFLVSFYESRARSLVRTDSGQCRATGSRRSVASNSR